MTRPRGRGARGSHGEDTRPTWRAPGSRTPEQQREAPSARAMPLVAVAVTFIGASPQKHGMGRCNNVTPTFKDVSLERSSSGSAPPGSLHRVSDRVLSPENPVRAPPTPASVHTPPLVPPPPHAWQSQRTARWRQREERNEHGARRRNGTATSDRESEASGAL